MRLTSNHEPTSWWRTLGLSLLASMTISVAAPSQADTPNSTVPRIIFDTDFGGDADDLGAIALLHHYLDQDMIDLLAIVSWSNERHALPALDAVNRWYGRPDLRLGVRKVPAW